MESREGQKPFPRNKEIKNDNITEKTNGVYV